MAQGRVAPILGFRDVRRAAEYYKDVLGFRERSVMEGEGEEAAVYAILDRDGTEIHLQIRRREIFADKRESLESDAYFFVPDADALHAELVGRGASILRPPQDEPYGLRDFAVEDLEGHRLLFGTPLS